MVKQLQKNRASNLTLPNAITQHFLNCNGNCQLGPVGRISVPLESSLARITDFQSCLVRPLFHRNNAAAVYWRRRYLDLYQQCHGYCMCCLYLYFSHHFHYGQLLPLSYKTWSTFFTFSLNEDAVRSYGSKHIVFPTSQIDSRKSNWDRARFCLSRDAPGVRTCISYSWNTCVLKHLPLTLCRGCLPSGGSFRNYSSPKQAAVVVWLERNIHQYKVTELFNLYVLSRRRTTASCSVSWSAHSNLLILVTAWRSTTSGIIGLSALRFRRFFM